MREIRPEECRSCGAPIFFVKTENNKSMPLDYEPVEDGNVVTVGVVAGVLKVRVIKAGEADNLPMEALRYKSHFATCPKAGEHRSRKRKRK